LFVGLKEFVVFRTVVLFLMVVAFVAFVVSVLVEFVRLLVALVVLIGLTGVILLNKLVFYLVTSFNLLERKAFVVLSILYYKLRS
jgi:hypothetical protein